MALSKAEKETLSEVATTVQTAASWLTGPRSRKLNNAANQLIDLIEGVATKTNPEP